jgi:membrane protease YdiL (CAAX protease family)
MNNSVPVMAADPSSPQLRFASRLVVVVAIVLPTVVTWIYFIWLHGAEKWLQQGAYPFGKGIQFALPIVWVWLVLREWPKLQRPSGWSLLAGTAFGLVVGMAMALLYFALLKHTALLNGPVTAIRAKIQSFGLTSPAAYIALAVFYSAIHSLLEEYYWRWFVFGQLARDCKWPVAIAVSSVAFAAHHVLVLALFFGWASPLTWLLALAVAIGGACWAGLYLASDSLAATWLSHALVDAAIFAIGYTIAFR